MAINTALKDIASGEIHPIPSHIKTHAKEYLYPHDFGGWVTQSYLSVPKKYYTTQQIGFEKTLWQWHEKIIQK
jgi:putative ATPase